MPYDRVRESLSRSREALADSDASPLHLVEALEELTCAVEKDFAQIKAALGHLATLLETRQRDST